MSDTTPISAALEGLRIRERELELDACAIRARVEEIRSMIEMLDPPRRKPGRPRTVSALNTYPSQIMEQAASARANTPVQMPQRVAGGAHGYREAGDGTLAAPIATEADLPSLDDVRGILRTDPPEAA